MVDRPHSPLANHRARKAREGFVRVEVSVRREDASLVRHVAAALTDPDRHATLRQRLRQDIIEAPKGGLKALLATAPLEGIDLERDRDFGRDVDL